MSRGALTMTDHKDLAFQPTMDEICLPAGELAELSVRAQTQKTLVPRHLR